MRISLPPGVIKTAPEHFIVQELVGSPARPVPLHEVSKFLCRNGNASHTLFHLTKRGVSSDDAMREVARQLDVRIADVSNHGMKDRHALTAQCVAVRGVFRPRFEHRDVVLHEVGAARSALIPGQHYGNRFTIFVESDARRLDVARIQRFRNTFGHQRFGTKDGHVVGRYLLEGDFEQAASIEAKNTRKALFGRLGRRMGWKDVFLRSEFRRETEFRIMQWQSYLWNTLVTRLDPLPERLPVWIPEDRALYECLWRPARIDADSAKLLHRFVRKTIVRTENVFAVRRVAGWELRFDLPSGAYATVALSRVFEIAEAVRP